MAIQSMHHPAVLRSRDFLGRDVLDAASHKIGTVKDMFVDRRSGAVRFLEVDLGTFRKNVIVPVNQVDWGEQSFVMRAWLADEVRRLPMYDPERPLTGQLLDELAWAYPRFYGDAEALPVAAGGDPNILPLREAKDFKVKDDDPDLRGWNVFGSDGERVGKVTDVLVDPAAMKVAYLEVDLHDDLFALKDDRHVLVPAEAVDLRERGKDIWVRDMEAQDLARLPAYTGGAADPAVLARVADAFDGHRETRLEPIPDPDRSP
jgi:sporulation protein YlmC with PRC-barrel domain